MTLRTAESGQPLVNAQADPCSTDENQPKFQTAKPTALDPAAMIAGLGLPGAKVTADDKTIVKSKIVQQNSGVVGNANTQGSTSGRETNVSFSDF
jgi:hypothetical protein